MRCINYPGIALIDPDLQAPMGTSQMRELSDRMNALVSQSCSATVLSFDDTNVVVIGREYD